MKLMTSGIMRNGLVVQDLCLKLRNEQRIRMEAEDLIIVVASP